MPRPQSQQQQTTQQQQNNYTPQQQQQQLRRPPQQLSSGSSFVHAVSLDWHHSPEGQGILAHLQDPDTGARKNYGFLERPVLPPTVQVAPFKLFISGRSGAGKTGLVSFLAGRQDWIGVQQGETPGIRVSPVFWPTKIRSQLVLFHLSLWDHGESAGKKYGHIQPVCRENSDGALFVFSFTDKAGFEDIDAGLTKLSQAATASGRDQVCPIVIGTRYGSTSDSEVTQQDLTAFENKWNRPVLKVRQQLATQQSSNNTTNSNEVAFVLNLICDQLWCHKQQQQPEYV